MSQNAPSGLQEEYDALRAQVFAFAGYFDSIGASGERSWLEAQGEERVTRTVIEGWREEVVALAVYRGADASQASRIAGHPLAAERRRWLGTALRITQPSSGDPWSA